jgi:hypothetical protein
LKNVFKYSINVVITASPLALLIWVAATLGTKVNSEMLGTVAALSLIALVFTVSALFRGRGLVYWRVNPGGKIVYKLREGAVRTVYPPSFVYVPTWQMLPFIGIVQEVDDPPF